MVPKLASGKVNDWEYLGLLSSPDVVGDKVYLVTSRCEVMCLDLNGQTNGNQGPFKDEGQYMVGPGKPPVEVTDKDADILWKYDMMDELGVFPHNAANCSVITLGNTLYTCTSNGQDWTHVNVPSPQAPSLIALDRTTGAFLAEDDAAIGPNIKHGQWSSPSIGTINGKQQVYFGGGNGILYAFNPEPVKEGDSTYLKKIWWFDCVPEEYKHDKRGHTDSSNTPAAEGPSRKSNATPVFYKNRVYVAIGQDPEHGEGVGRLLCIDATKSGDITKTGLIWDFKGIHRSISTVSIDPETGLLFACDFSGFLHCIDAETGKVYWIHDTQAHMWGSPMVADGKVYCGNEDGDFLVFAVSKEEKLLSKINMDAPILSTPIVANGTLFVNTATHLFAIAEGARAEATGPGPRPPRRLPPRSSFRLPSNPMSETSTPRLTLQQWLVLAIAAIGFLFDSYQLLMTPLVGVPGIAELLNLPRNSPHVTEVMGQLQWFSAACGGVFGFLGGWLIDRFGRKRIMIASILLLALSSRNRPVYERRGVYLFPLRHVCRRLRGIHRRNHVARGVVSKQAPKGDSPRRHPGLCFRGRFVCHRRQPLDHGPCRFRFRAAGFRGLQSARRLALSAPHRVVPRRFPHSPPAPLRS